MKTSLFVNGPPSFEKIETQIPGQARDDSDSFFVGTEGHAAERPTSDRSKFACNMQLTTWNCSFVLSNRYP